MAIGRLQAALASATNEVTVAAANINFDFTLIKCEAPKEYQALGNVLSKKRKENAEFGSSHVLARQLGALFDGVCPSASALLEAYGKRASEIANVAKEKSEPFVGTLFGEYTGIDGTSIWAAATSSTCALHIHLLACLLARVWTAPEAVAIWVELVLERKKSIARKVDEGEPVPFALAAAVGQDISRPQLAALDASARSWLKTADDIFCRKQTQLDLILKNLDLPMAGGSAVSSGVIETWKIALETMNKLVSGEPQAVQNGAALLGLSAWHVYPDMSVYNSVPIEIKMEDPCVTKGGILSLGVSRRPISSNQEGGVRWSLSLSHLRHYGRPVDVTRGLEADARLTWPQFKLVVFAALLERWRLQETHGETFARHVPSLDQYLDAHPFLNESDLDMFKFFKDGAAAYVKRDIAAESLDHKLIQLGRRRSHQFITDRQVTHAQLNPFRYSFDPSSFFSALKDTESAISFLRYTARRLSNKNTPPDAFIIRQKLPEPETSDLSSSLLPSQYSRYMMATALVPELQEGTGNAPHHRWLPADAHDVPVPSDETSTLDATKIFKCWEDGLQIITAHDPVKYIYRHVFAVSGTTALFSRVLSDDSDFFNYIPTIEDWNWCLDHDLFRPDMVLVAVSYGAMIRQSGVEPTLRSIVAVASVYDNIPNATIHTGVLMRSLKDTSWAVNAVSGNMEHEDVVSMISYLETGIHDIDPRVLKGVIGFSYTDSLFVSSALIQDPYETLLPEQTPHFQRILGNIGKPGLNFLLPPQQPIMRDIDAGSWRIDSYDDFDGTNSRSFENTSMHLSFTDYRVPHFDGLRGAYDSQIYFLESVISVQDKGEWVADVDPSPLIKGERYKGVSTHDDNVTEYAFCEGHSTYGNGGDEKAGEEEEEEEEKEEGAGRMYLGLSQAVHRLEDQGPCQHEMNSIPNHDITAVDTWNELLDVPKGIFVVRTGNNWVSKLAATLVTCQSMAQVSPKFAVTVCPPQVCWVCARKKTQHQAFIF